MVRLSLDDSPARLRFADLVARPVVPLAEAALAVAQEEYPEMDAGAYLRRIDELAASVEERLPSRTGPASTLQALRAVLFGAGTGAGPAERGFRGNTEAYYDPRNSFLNEVLDRRLGIPITLGVLTIEVAARVGLPLHGVGFPGHFLVKLAADQREIFIDPFRGGELLSADECAARHEAAAPGVALDPRHLESIGPRQILRRMLHNLQKIYAEGRDHVRALWVVDRLLLLEPGDLAARRDRGLLAARLGGTAAALADLEAYLAAEPRSHDRRELRKLVDELRSRTSLLN
jgi:regulator of sirC expression with transglutaminase-like and TPR domain